MTRDSPGSQLGPVMTTQHTFERVGFIGLGQMGNPMAMNLLKAGLDITVFSRSGRHAEDFKAAGARVASNLAGVADADVVILCLPGTSEVEHTVRGPDGLIHHLKSGALVIDTSTIDHAATIEIASSLKDCGIGFLDAPISGMEAKARAGTLTVMSGGLEADFDRALPLLQCIGKDIKYMGRTGSGQLTKLINQLLFDINCAALAEVLPMAVKLGLDPEKVGHIVNNGTGRSHASEFFIPRILHNEFTNGYPLKHAYKDLVSAAHLGSTLCIPMPVLAAATATYQMALLQGHGDKDKGAMIRPFEDLLGAQFRGASRS